MHRGWKMYFFLSAGIGENLTGIEHAILKRKKVFDACGLAHKIVTLNYNPNYLNNLNIHLIDSVSFLNLYDDYQQLIFAPYRKNGLQDYLKGISGQMTIEENRNTGDVRVYINDIYRFYIHFFNNGNISYINFFDKNKIKFKRMLYTASGYLSKIIYLNQNAQRSAFYYDRHQQVVIEENYNDDNELSFINLIEDGKEYFFQQQQAFIKHWFEKMLKSYKSAVFYSDKNKLYNEILVELKSSDFKLISVFHSVHVSNPKDTVKGRINSNYKTSLAALEKFDGYIVSTAQQKQDILARFGEHLKVWVIPPTFATCVPQPAKTKQVKPFRVISVGRYYVEKRLDHIIQAVELLKEKYSDIQLDLYGFGDARDNFTYEKKLRQYVEDQQLQQTVHFRGYVQDIEDKIRDADVSVVTSTLEGFCIGILDSLNVGTPVVAYDIKYGPSAMIEHDRSGMLVQEGDIAALAAAIEKCFLTPEMRVHAMHSATHYAMDAYTKKWMNHLLELSHV